MNARTLLALTALVTLTLAGGAYAVEESTASLVLHSTQMKTASDFIDITGSPVEGFSPTTIKCPAKTCTVRIEVASHFLGPDDVTYAHVRVGVDGSPDGIEPNDGADFEGHVNQGASAHTFTFMKEGLTKGDHTVTVQYAGSAGPGGQAFVGARILTLQIFKP
jgi:hypothetical protein